MAGATLLSLLQGATVVILPRFELDAFLAAVQDHAVTRAEVVPRLCTGAPVTGAPPRDPPGVRERAPIHGFAGRSAGDLVL